MFGQEGIAVYFSNGNKVSKKQTNHKTTLQLVNGTNSTARIIELTVMYKYIIQIIKYIYA